jgi:N-acetylmuramoyl-L-alanine amidase
VGGGTRTLDVVPWDLAQLPHIAGSTTFATSVEQKLRERQVPMNARPQDALPLRLLAGANMPAIIVEAGFVSNSDEASALISNDRQAAIVDALIAALADLRNAMTRGGGL